MSDPERPELGPPHSDLAEVQQIAEFLRSPERLASQLVTCPARPAAPKSPTPAPPAHSKLLLPKGDDETEAQVIARAIVNPGTRSATTSEMFARNDFGSIDINALTADVVAKCNDVADDNDLRHMEGMLTGQAIALEAIFHSLALKATGNFANPHRFEMYLRMALKAQSQCRTTIETLALVKNPKSATFVRQANIANGPQQVNNRTRAKKPKARKRQTKLLEP